MLDLTVSDLVAAHLPAAAGEDAGTCYVCGRETAAGQRRPPSETFTAWAACVTGDVLCPSCAATMGCRDARMFSWLATPERWRIHGRGDRGWLWDVLAEPPEPPFALYLTQGGQKQGWVSGCRQPALGRASVPVLTDWTDRPVLLRRSDWERYAPVVLALRARKVSKRALMTGGHAPATWSRAMREGWGDALRQAAAWAGDPRWEVVCYVSNGTGDDGVGGGEPDAGGAGAGAGGDGRVARLGLPLG